MRSALIALALTTGLILSGCTGGDSGTPKADNKSAEENVRAYKLSYDLSEEKRLQQAVDNGGQTWRKNPIDVAHAALTNQGANVRIENCSLVGEKSDDHCVVEVRGKDGVYRVHLKRLVRPGGIWTATEIDILENKQGGSNDR